MCSIPNKILTFKCNHNEKPDDYLKCLNPEKNKCYGMSFRIYLNSKRNKIMFKKQQESKNLSIYLYRAIVLLK